MLLLVSNTLYLVYIAPLLFISRNLIFTVIGEDYIPPEPFVTVHSIGSSIEACTNINITDDNNLEGYHEFSIEVMSTSINPSAIELPIHPVLIRIQDDERKHFIMTVGQVLVFFVVCLQVLL